MALPGTEFYRDPSLGLLERWYCRLWGIPIVGLRIRLRRIAKLLPNQATAILDAGCGRGVLTRILARRFPEALVVGIDENAAAQNTNTELAKIMGIGNCRFDVADVTVYEDSGRYDLIISVDNLEHVQDDRAVLAHFFHSLQQDGVAVIHVPHYYRRWPLFAWSKNFDVPGHVRPGYHLAELTERVRQAGFAIERSGFSYGWTENAINNLSYFITGAREQRKVPYALAFPLLNALAWLGQWSSPRLGAGVWVVARKAAQADRPYVIDRSSADDEDEDSNE